MTSKSIILIDFDNIFLALWTLDRALAVRFASEPQLWLQALTERYLIENRRRWLVARCYLNPAGFVYSDEGPNGRLFFSRFRPLWVGAGFEVIDTPTLARNKNAADIRIVIDALDLVGHSTRFDEFVIASGDSDFTPLLQRLRANDRFITVISPGNASRAYTSLADKILDIDALDALLRPEQIEPDIGPATSRSVEVDPQLEQAFSAFVRSEYAEATAPIPLASLAHRAAAAVPGARESKWLGTGGFAMALERLDLPNAAHNGIHLWDEERHQAPLRAEPFLASDLPEVVELLSRTVDMPRLSRPSWSAVFRKLADYARKHDFNLTESSKWTRDSLAEEKIPVGRAVLSYVIRGAQFGGAPLDTSPPPSTEDIASAFMSNLINQAYSAGMTIDREDEDVIADWLGLSPTA